MPGSGDLEEPQVLSEWVIFMKYKNIKDCTYCHLHPKIPSMVGEYCPGALEQPGLCTVSAVLLLVFLNNHFASSLMKSFEGRKRAMPLRPE